MHTATRMADFGMSGILNRQLVAGAQDHLGTSRGEDHFDSTLFRNVYSNSEIGHPEQFSGACIYPGLTLVDNSAVILPGSERGLAQSFPSLRGSNGIAYKSHVTRRQP